MFESLFELNKLNFVNHHNLENNYHVYKSKDTFKWFGDINSINDIMELYKNISNQNLDNIHSNINLNKLKNIIKPLEDLNNMIGILDIKKKILNHVIYHLQDLDNENNDFHHTVIEGPPGVGKTKLCFILADIYKGLGILKKGKVISVKREDLIAGYLGQTGEKTRKKLEEAIGNVLLFDEAYSIGNNNESSNDSYAQQVIDLLNRYLSEKGHEFICIIAGYKEELNNRFFNMNPGLKRRFPIHYEINNYSANELYLILNQMIINNKWSLNFEKTMLINFFEENKDYFKNYGGDLLNFFTYIKKSHSKYIMKISDYNDILKNKKKINFQNINDAFQSYKLLHTIDKTYLHYYT